MNGYAIPFAIVIAGLAIAGAVYFGDGGKNNLALTNTSGAKQETSFDPINKTDHILGNPNAKILIVEYSDTECPWCKTFHPTMQRIMSEYGPNGDVAWVYRHLIVIPGHTKAFKEAEATECVAKIGGNEKFWEYLSKLFETTPANNGLDLALLPKMAKDVGIDEDAFNKCLESGEMKSIVDAQMAKAPRAGTPHSYVVVKGKVIGVIEGAQPYDMIKSNIDAVLK